MHQGGCLCGAVRFTVEGELPPPDACHCRECRRWTGHFLASSDVSKSAVRVTGEVTWYRSSEKVRRGFCGTCGSSLFSEPLHRDWTAVAMGAVDVPSGTRLAHHIFTAEKGDYYDIADGLPQRE